MLNNEEQYNRKRMKKSRMKGSKKKINIRITIQRIIIITKNTQFLLRKKIRKRRIRSFVPEHNDVVVRVNT